LKHFLNRTSIVQKIIARIEKEIISNYKTSAHQRKTITRMKRQFTEWEKIFASYPSKE
jgi:hypothetical protein